MTICIGALCNNGDSVVLVADRMVTLAHLGNLKQDDHSSKIHKFSEQCYTMNSGKLQHAYDVYEKARKIKNNEAEHFKIAEAYKSYSLDLAVESILQTRGFANYEEFIDKKNDINESVANKLDKEIRDFDIQANIITVFYDSESNKYHLGLLEGDRVYKNLDSTGLCSIGIKFQIVEFCVIKEGFKVSNSIQETKELLTKTIKDFKPYFDGIGSTHDIVCLNKGKVEESTI